MALPRAPRPRTIDCDDQSIRLWSTTSGRQEAQLLGHTEMVQSLAFSPDGATFASGGQDGALRLWSMADRVQLGHPVLDRRGFVPALAV